MSSDLWLGTAFSIPIGVGIGLGVPKIQRKLDSYSRARSIRVSKKTLGEFSRIKVFKENPHELTQYLLIATLRILLVSTITLACCSFLVFMGFRAQNEGGDTGQAQFLFVCAYGFGSVGFSASCFSFSAALATWNKVRNFEEYRKASMEAFGRASEKITSP
jgi:hypothetical protein